MGQTYLNYKFEFSDTELSEAFSDACDYVGEEASPADIIKDAMESVCVIQRDGLDNIFSHRSFQEYFCALFIARYREADAKGLIEAVASMENRSNVLRMLMELSPETVEYEWIVPILENFNDDFGRVKLNTKTGLGKFLDNFCNSLYVNSDTGTIHLISWSAPVDGKLEFGRWMGIVQDAYNQRDRYYGPLFSAQIWPKRTDFSFIPESVRPSGARLSDIQRPSSVLSSEVSSKFTEYELTKTQADWLIYTHLPEIFEGIRGRALEHLRELNARRSARRGTVRNLLTKPKRRLYR